MEDTLAIMRPDEASLVPEAAPAEADVHPPTSASDPAAGGRALHAPGSPMEGVLRLAEAMARRNAPILLHGESGTGKEVLARWVHARSLRREGPFVAVNCAAISPSLAESELFGHCRGAFTHAVHDRPGHIRQAEGGTLFLDEIGDMPLELQARFLRALQEKTVRPVGGDIEIPVDFRLVCATHRDLSAEVRAGRFRGDLYYRLRVLELRLPPLRERPMDIPWLLCGFLSELDEEAARQAVEELPLAALRYHYPGNVRELRNLAERYAALREIGGGWEQAMEGCLHAEDRVMEASPEYARARRTSRLTLPDVLSALEACGYHRGKASAKLGVTRRTLQYHLAKLKARDRE